MIQLPGFAHWPGALDVSSQRHLVAALEAVVAEAPLYVPTMPRTGRPMSVRMTNCGPLGWVTDKTGGYRYQSTHPVTGRPWPPMPAALLALWEKYADFPAPPEACLVNYYGIGAKMGLHKDADEEEFAAPVLSVSLGSDAVFIATGAERAGVRQKILLRSGDVMMLSGPARLAYHGIDRVLPGTSDLLPDGGRINLTLRRVTRI